MGKSCFMFDAVVTPLLCLFYTPSALLQPNIFTESLAVNKIITPILGAAMLLGCTNSKTKPMTASLKSPEAKQESISGYAPVNGLKMYYEIHGEGTPLVLVHGGGSTIRTTFERTLPLFAKNHKIIAVELQAHGHTSDRDQPESFEQDADDVAGLLHYLKIDKAHLLGFSNGGNTVMQVALRHPELVQKLVVISAFYQLEGMVPGFFAGLEQATLQQMPELLKVYYLQTNNDQQGLQNMFNKDRQRMLNFKDWSDTDLQSITAPTFLLAADKDVVTPEHTVKMSRLIPDCRLLILPGTHGSFIGEVCSVEEGSRLPEITVAIIEEFLSK